jgi:hypothetical protein
MKISSHDSGFASKPAGIFPTYFSSTWDPGPLLVFVETVATDGAVTAERKEALLRIATTAGYRPQHVAFVTAYQDRGSSGFKKTVSRLAWGSFAWFATEPDHLLVQYEGIGGHASLATLLGVHEAPG